MQIDTLKYFVEVCRTGSFYAASQKLFISPQGLNRSISALESELDTKLLERSRSGIELTSDGELFLDRAQHILSEYDGMLGELFESKRSKTLGDAPIKLHISYYAAQTAASDPEYVRLLSNSAYIELPFEKLIDQALSSDGSDLVFLDLHGHSLRKIYDNPDLTFEPLVATYYGVVWKEGSSLAKRETLHRSEVNTLPIATNTFREMDQLTNSLFAEYPLQDIRLGATNPRMLIECAQTAPGTVATFDSFGFHLAQSDSSMPTEGLGFTRLATPEALCFMGFLQPKAVKQTLRVRYVKHVLRQYLGSHVASYFVRYPTEKLWAEAIHYW